MEGVWRAEGGGTKAVVVHEDAHQLGHADRRVRVVQLHRHLLGELLPRAAGLGRLERLDHVLSSGKPR